MPKFEVIPVIVGLTATALGVLILAQAIFYMVQLVFKRSKHLAKYDNFKSKSDGLINIGWMIFLEFWGIFLISVGASLICLSFDPGRTVPLTKIVTAVSYYMFFASIAGTFLIFPIMFYGFHRMRKKVYSNILRLEKFQVDDEADAAVEPEEPLKIAA